MPTLARGYAIVMDAESGKAISSVRDAKADQTLITQFSDGQLGSRITDINKKPLK